MSFLVAFYDEKWAKHSYFTSDGERHVVDCLTGVTQGCGLGSTMYSIATFVVVKAAMTGNPGCDETHNVAFADDGTSLGPKNQVIEFAGEIKNRLRDEAGLHFRKWEIYGGVDALDAVKAEEVRRLADDAGLQGARVEEKGFDLGRATPSAGRGNDRGIRLLGAPVGDSGYAAKYVYDTAVEHETLLGDIAELGRKDGYDKPHEAYQLLRFCAVPRITHLYGLVPEPIARDGFRKAHSDLISTGLQIAGIPETELSGIARTRLALGLGLGGAAITGPEGVADEALIANWNACATVLREAPALKEVIGGRSPPRGMRTRGGDRRRDDNSGPMWGALPSIWDEQRRKLQRVVEDARRAVAPLEESLRRAESVPGPATRRQHTLRTRKAADASQSLKEANAMLANSEKALDLFPCDFQDWDRNAAECKIKWKGVQRALSTLAHTQRWASLHSTLLESGGLDGQPAGAADDADGESPGVVADNRTAAQLEARAEAASLLSSGGGEAMLWLEHGWNYGTANLTPAEFRSAFRFSFEIPEPALTRAAVGRRPCACGGRDCGGKVFSTGRQYVYHVLNRKSDTGGGSACKRHNMINNTVRALAERAGVTALVGGYSCVVPRDPRGEGDGESPHADIWFELASGDKFWGDLTLVNVVGGGMRTRFGSERVSGAALRAAREKKEETYAVAAEEDARRVFTLGIEMGGRMDPQFHEVLYRLARADADAAIGPLAEGADASRVAEHKMHLKRVKRRMIAAIQTTRIKWAVRCINSACPHEGVRVERR